LTERKSEQKQPLVLTLADYNPTVLYLVTLPNLILAWALQQRAQNPLVEEAFTPDGELDLTPEVLEAFKESLASNRITLSFLSGAWSPEFVDLLSRSGVSPSLPATTKTLVLGSETIYSPFALESFSTTLLSILERERRERPNGSARALIAAKRLYFGVGGSLDDFVDKMRGLGAAVRTLFEETQGVHRGVVECQLF
jgi:protein-histidine N-methyltransferase